MTVNTPSPIVSVIILNWNAAQWIPRCLDSLRQQTFWDKLEIIFTDNFSIDDSEKIARAQMADWPNARFIHTGGNYGFGGGCNRGAAVARGKYLFFLNPDVWLEPDCVEQLVAAGEKSGAPAVAAKVLNYADDSVQWWRDDGYDIFGQGVSTPAGAERDTSFSACTFPFVRADTFCTLGGFDEQYFMYGEEGDLAWGLWVSGGRVELAPRARIHHRGEAAVNPRGGEQIAEFRTSKRKRFYANRNHLLTLLKYPQHILWLLPLAFTALLVVEGIFWLLWTRNWSLAKTTSFDVLQECWRMRHHISEQRRLVKKFRRRGDFGMLQFFRFRLGVWREVKKMFRLGTPKIS
jgi:GT2 family glycosyltransferase